MRSVSPIFIAWAVPTLLGIVCAGLSFTRLRLSVWVAVGGLPSLCAGVLLAVFTLVANDQFREAWTSLLIFVGSFLCGALSSVRYLTASGDVRLSHTAERASPLVKRRAIFGFRYLIVAVAAWAAWVLLSASTWLGGEPAVTRLVSARMEREREAMLKWEQRDYPDDWNRLRALPWQPRIVFFRSVALAPGLFLCRYDLLDNAPLCQRGEWGLFLWTGVSTRQIAGRWVWIE